MFGSSKSYGASAYTKIGVETGVIAASPHKLIVMLFDGAITAIGNALQQMQKGEIAAKGKSISTPFPLLIMACVPAWISESAVKLHSIWMRCMNI
jgi:flagellar protein FliS